MQILCFEDALVERLRPIVLARPTYAITSASFRLIDLLRQLDGTLIGSVRDYLNDIQSLDFGVDGEIDEPMRDGYLLVNARVVPRVPLLQSLKQLAASAKSAAVIDEQDGSVLAARITASSAKELADGPSGSSDPVGARLISFAATLPPAEEEDGSAMSLPVFRWPHDVVAAHMQDMGDAMRWRIEHGDYRQLQDGVFVSDGASIGEYASIHTEEHPIILEKNVSVGPFCFLEGPLYAGAGARVLEHAAIKDGVSLGHTVKIGGEVEASVIEPFTNKQHHGFLGHSYLGSWINLGAGTCNSDLKNTYGKINIEYGDEKIATGMQFLGCIMGDYAKTAINTGIFTGKVIGVCSMLYGFITANVPSYVNYARLFGQTSLLPPDIMINTQQRMFARRKVEQRDCDMQLIRDMYERTSEERDASDQLSL